MDLIFNLNPYIMCNNSPLMNIDSLGLKRFVFNTSKCTLTLELEFEIDYEDEINFGYGDENKRHDYISGKWNNEQEKRDYENATKDAIMDYWNNHPYIIKPNKECCPCFKTGIKPQLKLLLDQYFNADIKIYVVKENTEHDKLDGKVVREYNTSSGMRLRSNTSARTINHEFGHAMGLSHPGKGLKKVNIPKEVKKRHAKGTFDKIGPNELSEYYHTGKDINGNEVHYTDLMGAGKNKRPFYYDKWKEFLNSYLRKGKNMCVYTIK